MDREWFEGRSTDEEMASCYWKRVISIALTGLIVLLLVWPFELHSEPVARTADGGVVITLHDGKCQLSAVTNLPQVAIWEEKGQTFTGCWGLNKFGIVVLYFNDRTAVGIPAQFFERVQGV